MPPTLAPLTPHVVLITGAKGMPANHGIDCAPVSLPTCSHTCLHILTCLERYRCKDYAGILCAPKNSRAHLPTCTYTNLHSPTVPYTYLHQTYASTVPTTRTLHLYWNPMVSRGYTPSSHGCSTHASKRLEGPLERQQSGINRPSVTPDREHGCESSRERSTNTYM
jgi:hypothetical protein